MDDETAPTSRYGLDGALHLLCRRSASDGCTAYARYPGLYCSRECARAAWNEQRRAKRAEAAAARPEIPCKWCGESFRPTRSDAKYCKTACRVRAHRHPEGGPEQSRGVVRRADDDRDERARQVLRATLDNFDDLSEAEVDTAIVETYTILAGRPPAM